MGIYPSRFVRGRREKMNGFLLIDKPAGITSQGVVQEIKRKLNLKKCGHTGTLDPDATGLLVVACDEATKVIRLLTEEFKEYQTTIVFGLNSNTLDIYGKITEEVPMSFSLEKLDEALVELKSQTLQFPPMVSAIKVAGKKLYEYEREHKSVDILPRNVKINEIRRLTPLKLVDGHLSVDVAITCSKGFYVRSFARDLGQALGGCAILKDLRRIRSGRFDIDAAHPLAQIEESQIISIEEILPFSKLEVNDFVLKLVQNGVILDERQIQTEEPFYITYQHKIVALYEVCSKNKYKPVIIFKGKEG